MSVIADQQPATDGASGRLRRVVHAHAVLTMVLLAALLAQAWLGYRVFGEAGVWPAVISVALLWGCGTGCLWILATPWVNRQGVGVTLFASVLRTVLPMLVGLYLVKTRPDLAEAGLAYQLLATYLLTLVLETVLSVRVLDPCFSSFKNKRV